MTLGSRQLQASTVINVTNGGSNDSRVNIHPTALLVSFVGFTVLTGYLFLEFARNDGDGSWETWRSLSYYALVVGQALILWTYFLGPWTPRHGQLAGLAPTLTRGLGFLSFLQVHFTIVGSMMIIGGRNGWIAFGAMLSPLLFVGPLVRLPVTDRVVSPKLIALVAILSPLAIWFGLFCRVAIGQSV